MSDLRNSTPRFKETNPHFITRQYPQPQSPSQQPHLHAQPSRGSTPDQQQHAPSQLHIPYRGNTPHQQHHEPLQEYRPYHGNLPQRRHDPQQGNQNPTAHFIETNPHFTSRLHPKPHSPIQQPQPHIQPPRLQPEPQSEPPLQHRPHHDDSATHQHHEPPQLHRPHHDDSPAHQHLAPPLPIRPYRGKAPKRPHETRPQKQHRPHQGHLPPQNAHLTRQPRHSSEQILHVPPPRRTKLVQWCCALFCAIFWILVILGGLIVLIVYLLYRPQSPRFDLSSVTLNAAYLDMGYLLNADMTMLANFTNPNKKVKINFSTITLNLYYEDTLIATQYIEPFSASRKESRFANIHMVTSQVRLPVKNILSLKKQMQGNNILFQVKGFFRTKSSLGGFLRYSYWLYAHCSFVVTGPPNGAIVSKKCRTKR